MKHWLAFLLGVSLLAPAHAGPPPGLPVAQLREVNEAVYRMDHARAKRLCEAMITTSPDDPAAYVFLARTYWSEEMNKRHALSLDRFAAPDFFAEQQGYKYRIEVDRQTERRFLTATDQAIAKAKAILDRQPDNIATLYLLGLAYQNLATWDVSLRGAWWSAFRSGARALRYHRQTLAAQKDFADPHLAIGVYEYIAGRLPWNIRWLTFLIGHSGSVERGRQHLENAAANAVLAGDDARIILSLIYTRERAYERALDKLNQLAAAYPENYLVALDRAGTARRMGRYDTAIESLGLILGKVHRREDGFERLDRSSVYNQIGLAWREKGALRAAENWFRLSIDAPDVTPRTRTVAQLALAKTLDLAHRRGEALTLYRTVAAAPDVAGSSEEAAAWLKHPYEPGPKTPAATH